MNNLKIKTLSIFALSALSFSAYADTDTRQVITTDWEGNITGAGTEITSGNVPTNGGAIYNSGTNVNITGDFTDNYVDFYNAAVTTTGISSYGGAIYNVAKASIDTISGNFSGNYVDMYAARTTTLALTGGGGAIANMSGSTISYISGSFTENSVYVSDVATNSMVPTANAFGGAIYNIGTIVDIDADFSFNNVTSYSNAGNNNTNDASVARGGAIYNTSSITSISGDFIGNSATASAANDSNGNTALTAQGGAIFNTSTISSISGSFIGNYASIGAVTTSLRAENIQGGAVFNSATGSITFNTTSSDIEFTGNYVVTQSATTSNAIYNLGTVNFASTGDYKIVVNDGISGSSTAYGDINITSGTTVLNNVVSYQDIVVSDGATLILSSYAGTSDLYGDGSNVSVSASSADLSASNLTIDGTLILSVSSNESSISLGSTTITESGEWILDLSNITGEFSFEINGSASLDFLDDNNICVFDVILGDDSIMTPIYELDLILDENGVPIGFSSVYTAASEDDPSYYVEFTVGNSTSGGYLLTGTVYGTAVPEPSTYAMIFGVLALGFAYYRRRK